MWGCLKSKDVVLPAFRTAKRKTGHASSIKPLRRFLQPFPLPLSRHGSMEHKWRDPKRCWCVTLKISRYTISTSLLQKHSLSLCTLCWGYTCSLRRYEVTRREIWRIWYSWEWFTSLEFDWQYLSGKRAFRWPMVCLFQLCMASYGANIAMTKIFYFLNRYCLLFALIGMYGFHYPIYASDWSASSAIALNVTVSVPTTGSICRVVDSSYRKVNCQGLYTFNQVRLWSYHTLTCWRPSQCFGNAAIGLASINLSLRT